MTAFEIPTVTTERLRLRAFRPSDRLLGDAGESRNDALHGHGAHV
jgi:hypothetical protein